MNIRTKIMQLFAAGDVVNYAGNKTGSNAGAYNTNSDSAVTTGLLAPEIKEYYDKALIVLTGPNLVHEQFGQKRPIPKGNGRTIEFRKFSRLPKATSPITEGVTPTGGKMEATSVTATTDQYGYYLEGTDVLSTVAIDNVKNEGVKMLSQQAGLTFDTVVRNELVGGTNVMYAPSVSGGSETEITSRTSITSLCKLRVKDVFKAAAELKAVNAPKINGSYVAIIHPYVAYDLMQEAGEKWLGIAKYVNKDGILKGEIGTLGGVRFVESTEAKIYAPAVIGGGYSRLTVKTAIAESTSSVVVEEEIDTASSLSIDCYIGGVANKITAITKGTGQSTLTVQTAITSLSKGATVCGKGGGTDGSAVFCTLFLGDNAYGVTENEGLGLEYIAKPAGYGNDPLNQRWSQGWKGTKVAKRLVEEYLIRYESGSEFSATAESN